MKWIFRNAILVILLALCASLYAASSQDIFGLDKAKVFNQSVHHPVFIQVSEFADHTKAENFRKRIKSQTVYPVIVVRKSHYYAVKIGPIMTAAEVRKTANDVYGVATAKPNSKGAAQPVMQPKKLQKPRHHAKLKPRPKLQAQPKSQPQPQYVAAREKEVDYKTLAVELQTPSAAKWFVAAGAGAAFPSLKSNIKVANGSGAPAPYNQDNYTTQNSNQPLVSFAGGRRWERQNQWFPAYAVGLYYQHTFSTNAGNTITQYSAPGFTNYAYTWNISSDILLATFKLNLLKYRMVSPYIMAGLGGSYNRNDYSEKALPGVTSSRVSPAFATNTSVQFAYDLGAGIDFQVNPQIIVSAEYQYQNLGNMSLGKGAGTWSGESLNLGRYHANAFLMNVTYLFDQ